VLFDVLQNQNNEEFNQFTQYKLFSK